MQVVFVILQPGHGCGEPTEVPNSQRFGSVTRVSYKCYEGYTGGGNATCQRGKWQIHGSCKSKYFDHKP